MEGNMNKLIAEFIGTFTLVLFGCGAAVIAGMGENANAVSQLWLFIVAPLVGAGIAGLMFKSGILAANKD
jgi:aquaporin Z